MSQVAIQIRDYGRLNIIEPYHCNKWSDQEYVFKDRANGFFWWTM